MYFFAAQFSAQIRVALLLITLASIYGCNVASSRVHQQSGRSYYRQGNLQMAQAEFHRALADDPRNATNAHNLATTMNKQGNLVGAEQMFHDALKLDSNHQPAYHGLSQLMVSEGRKDEALTLLNNWQASNPNQAAPHIEMAWLQNETGDITGAEQSLRTALQKQPNHPTAMSNLGQLFEQTGRTQEAKVMYQRSLSNNLHQPEVYKHLAATRGYPTGNITGIVPRNGQALMAVPPTPTNSPLPTGIPAQQIQQPLLWPASPQSTSPPSYQPTGYRKPSLFKTYSATPTPPPLLTVQPKN